MEATNPEVAATNPETPAAAAKAPKRQLVTQNGVSRPEGASTGRVWAIADEISARHGRPALRAEVIEQAEVEGLNRGTITTQYGRWMTFNGVDRTQLADIRKQLKADAAPDDADADADADDADADDDADDADADDDADAGDDDDDE